MATKNDTPNCTQPVRAPLRTTQVSDLMEDLFERAASQLSTADLEVVANNLPIAAKTSLGHVRDTALKVGVLITEDALEGGADTGVYQDSADVSRLLFLLSDAVDEARGMLAIAETAGAMLKSRGAVAAPVR